MARPDLSALDGCRIRPTTRFLVQTRPAGPTTPAAFLGRRTVNGPLEKDAPLAFAYVYDTWQEAVKIVNDLGFGKVVPFEKGN